MLVHNYTAENFFAKYLTPDSCILNAGSKATRFGNNCINIDIAPGAGVDIVGDIHHLPDDIGLFDGIICTAVLQYCENPFQVAAEFLRALKPGGMLYIDAPWIQGYCPDTPDKWRFSADGLRSIFKDFDIQECAPGIKPGSAWSYLGYQLAADATRNRYVNFALRNIAKVMRVFNWVDTAAPEKLAGSFYLVGTKNPAAGIFLPSAT